MHIGKTAMDAIMVICQLFVMDAKQVQNRGVEVVDGDRVTGNLVTDFIGFTPNTASLDSGSSEPAGKGMLVMIPTQRGRAPVALAERGSAELRGPNHQSVFQHAPLF